MEQNPNPSIHPSPRVVDVSAALIFRGGKLLITRRHSDAHLGGLWEFPGGKREPDETFKQNTDDVRSSPAIDLCQRLQKEGASLRVHDPKAMDKARSILNNVTFVDDMNAVAEGCDAIVIATEWDEFQKLDLERARKSLTHPIMFDGRNLFDREEMERLGWIYKSVGR